MDSEDSLLESVLAPPRSTGFGSPASYCELLHEVCTSLNVQYGILAAQWRKRLYTEKEYLAVILDVVPLVPGTLNTPQENAQHTYIEVGRSDVWTSFASFFGLWGKASDEVEVVGQAELASGYDAGIYCDREDRPQPNLPGRRIASMSWAWDGGKLPNLVDVFEFVGHLSLLYPRHNVVTRPRHWFAYAVFETFQHVYGGHHDHVDEEFRRGNRFTPALPRSLLSFALLKRVCRENIVEAEEIVGRVQGE